MPIAQRRVARPGMSSTRWAKRAAAIIGAGMVMFLVQVEVAATIIDVSPIALVVGNSDYEHLGPLPGVSADVAAMGQSLTSLGFEVEVATNLARADFVASVTAFQARSQGRSAALFYYSGRAVTYVGAFGRDMDLLLPVETVGEAQLGYGIDADDVIAGMEGDVNLVLLDAPMSDRARVKRTNTLIAYAGGWAQVTPQGSVFTNALLKAMSPRVDVVDMVRTAIRSVRHSEFDQEPWMEFSLRRPYRLPSPARFLLNKLDARLVASIEQFEAARADASVAGSAANDVEVPDEPVAVRVIAETEDAVGDLKRLMEEAASGEVVSTFENTIYAYLPVVTIATLARSDLVHRVDLDEPVVAPPAQTRGDAEPGASAAQQDEGR